MTGMLPHFISNSGLRHADAHMQMYVDARRHTHADADTCKQTWT